MKYAMYIILLVGVIIGIISAIHLYRVSLKNKKEMSKYTSEEIKVNKDFGKALVVYYSLSNHTKEIAEMIKLKTGADIYEIKTAEELNQSPKLYLAIKKQLNTGQYPEINHDLPDLSQYDIIFVGAPVWWYTIATPMLSYLQQTDFMGKKVVPFSTQGSNPGKFFEDFGKKAKNAKILKSEKFNNLPAKYNQQVENKLAVWLNSLDL